MTDLKDGQSVEVQGSARRPYVLKNRAGVLSCTCAAWRSQSLPIEMRTCRHLRALRGDSAENARVGMPSSVRPPKPAVKAPPLLLAETWDGELDPTGYWLSEKLDGVRAFWDGKQFLSRQGNRFHAPAWFTAGLPLEPLDGELWLGRKSFQRTVSIVRRHDEPDLWLEIRFLVFDAPADDGPFETRLKLVDTIMTINRPAYASAHPHVICSGRDHLDQEMAHIEGLKGEGIMLRKPGSPYKAGRSDTLLKVKRWRDAEAKVIGYEPGAGRHKGRMGALVVEMANGVQFEIGTGFTDAQREKHIALGRKITFRYFDKSDSGAPRFASFLRVNADNQSNQQGEVTMPTSISKRRFEFVCESSDKFWEIGVNGNNVEVRFGRNSTNGQTTTKTLPDNVAAEKHADKLIREKLGKGYCEVK